VFFSGTSCVGLSWKGVVKWLLWLSITKEIRYCYLKSRRPLADCTDKMQKSRDMCTIRQSNTQKYLNHIFAVNRVHKRVICNSDGFVALFMSKVYGMN